MWFIGLFISVITIARSRVRILLLSILIVYIESVMLVNSQDTQFGQHQCDQMARLYFNIGPFASTKKCHNSKNVGQIRFKSLLKTN